MTDSERGEYDRSVRQLRSRLAEAEFKAAWAEERGKTMEQAVSWS